VIYVELETMLSSCNWNLIKEFFDNKIKQEVVDLVGNSKQIGLDDLKESQTRIECYREFINLPSTVVSLNLEAKEKDNIQSKNIFQKGMFNRPRRR